MAFQIEITPTALGMINKAQDRRIRAKIIETIDGLAEDLEKKGKPLTAELDGYHSVRAVGQRSRIIYRIDNEKVIVLVVVAGIQKKATKKTSTRLRRSSSARACWSLLLQSEDSPTEDAKSEDET